MRTLGVVAAVGLAIAGCGSSSSTSSSSPAAQAPTSVPSASSPGFAPPATPAPPRCVGGGGYGGIGASVSAFKNHNNTLDVAGQLPNEILPGVAYWEIDQVRHGCVTSYGIYEATKPPQGNAGLLSLFGGINEPNDATQVNFTNQCAEWKSNTLKKITGKAYALAVAQYGQQGSMPGFARMTLSSTPGC